MGRGSGDGMRVLVAFEIGSDRCGGCILIRGGVDDDNTGWVVALDIGSASNCCLILIRRVNDNNVRVDDLWQRGGSLCRRLGTRMN